ncbi:hypothetical protein E2C01_039500 [Portunus trituberculatus]|uniref:Uncharacterized protein n=1 Tax=Portunus trituberculatus TaxID=210409 RepID=A0A5B7FJW1_PORTR|nr:hypothetical protein [Portunus trituberculatus]
MARHTGPDRQTKKQTDKITQVTSFYRRVNRWARHHHKPSENKQTDVRNKLGNTEAAPAATKGSAVAAAIASSLTTRVFLCLVYFGNWATRGVTRPAATPSMQTLRHKEAQTGSGVAGLKAAAEWAARDSPANPRHLPDTKGKLSGPPFSSEGQVGARVARKCLLYGTMRRVPEVFQGDMVFVVVYVVLQVGVDRHGPCKVTTSASLMGVGCFPGLGLSGP